MEENLQALKDLAVTVIAASVDDEEQPGEVAAALSFPVPQGVTRHQADGVQPIGVGHRVAAPHRAGLDGVDHGVDPGGGGERLGPGDRQGRVEDRQIGPQGVAPGP